MEVHLTSQPLESFSAVARGWFEAAFAEPTDIQRRGWPEIASGRHSLLCAPTGSGKTLAAFFWCLDRLVSDPAPAEKDRCRVLYVSPLKALTVDVDRNLRAPLRGLTLQARNQGIEPADVRVAIRTGDTPAAERREMQRHPPDVLITTPESLFLILTSAARSILTSVRWIIVDEIHTMADSKRGAHLAISLERLAEQIRMAGGADPQRIGLSATQRPLEEVGHYLGGRDRTVSIVDAGLMKELRLTVEAPVEDMSDPDRGSERGGPVASMSRSGTTAAQTKDEPGLAPELPRRSIWPAVYPRILELIREHRSTIIFCNSRRMAERLAGKLNELAGEELVRAHHGSIAREHRALVEDMLKAGELPALVATSSLELGIDMGAVDLVIQISSPTSVARGIQRIGRAGHSVGEPSYGVILPTHRGDLLECATLAERMLTGEIETTSVPRNPLDVLAQQIVAMCALDQWPVDDLRRVVTGAYPFVELGDRAFEATLDMLDGRYPADDFAELRPRIVWDRVNGTLRGRAGAQRLAVTSGGTIPDRGLFTVNLLDSSGPDGGLKRVGELDEEMVYELRVGEMFVLGASTWKTAEITQSQVRVVPAPGEPGKTAFWHGDALGRPVEDGLALGRLSRKLLSGPRKQALGHLREKACLDHVAAENLLAYLEEQRQATGAVPDDQTVVVERFRDQLGDWRICVLTPWGAKVHAPWALAIEARLRDRLGLEVQSIYSDDGLALRVVESEAVPEVDDLLLDPDEVRDAVTSVLYGSALFASRFRENAARALLLPRRRPGSRTPLWLQRQRSADLLGVASRYPDFPILAETYRECLVDVFDLPALTDLMRGIRSRQVRVVEVETAAASPFASSLVFDYIAQYIYEGDTPLAERRAQALTLDPQLLAELLGSEDLHELLDAEIMSNTELELQCLAESRHPHDVDAALDVFRRVGDLSEDEAGARGIPAAWLAELAHSGRIVAVRIAGEERWIAAEDAGRYRDAFGIALPSGIPASFLAPVSEPLALLLRRWSRTHAPFGAAEPALRWGAPARDVTRELERLVAADDLVMGRFHAAGGEPEYCSAEVLRVIRRRSLAALRREVEPVPPVVLGRFLPAWQGCGSTARGVDRLAEIVRQLQGAPVPVSVLERDVIAARMDSYSPQLLDHLVASGEVVWIGRGALGPRDGRVALYLRGDVARLSPEAAEPAQGEVHRLIRERLGVGPCFFGDIQAATDRADREAVLDALWEMVWSGEVTNDTYAPLRFAGSSGRAPRRGVPMRLGPPRSLGRWSLVRDLLPPGAAAPTIRGHAWTETLLQRYGVLTREPVLAEQLSGGFVGLYAILRSMEESGKLRRGYFIEGLGGAQFALPGAVDRLRSFRDPPPDEQNLLLAATDPANPYGVTVSWPEMRGRPARIAGAYVVLDGGELRLYVERGGRSLV
ncbi:MAG TPA: DEAD/DEAH box helicase, partial [Chloroflexota bacterium]|nr:DEAD/DEAH box helicase [Chloroflexota bacterium]